MNWPVRLLRFLGLEGLGPEGAAVNAARSLSDDHRASSDLEDCLNRFAHPSGSEPTAPTAPIRVTPLLRWEPIGGTDGMQVTFEVPFDGHDGLLAVVGDFNDWDPTATLFTRRGESRQAAVTVQAGRRYEYRYFAAADWQWSGDRHDYGFEPDGLTVDNSVLDLTGARGAQ